MRLGDDGIACGQACEQPGIEIPGREGRATDGHCDAARHDAEALRQADRLALALRLLPLRLAGRAVHLRDRVGDRLETAILGVWAARLERHAPRLAGRVLHRVGDEETLLVEPRKRFERDAGARLDRGAPPRLARRDAGRNELVHGGGWITHVEGLAVGRRLGADEAFGGMFVVEDKSLAEERLEGCVALGLGRLAIDLRGSRFRIGAEIGAGADSVDCSLQQRFVTSVKVRHRLLP